MKEYKCKNYTSLNLIKRMGFESGLESTLKDLKEIGCDYCSGNYTECKNYNDPLKWKDEIRRNIR